MGRGRNTFIVNPKYLNLALIFETCFQVFCFVFLQEKENKTWEAVDQVFLWLQGTNLSLSIA